MLLWLRVHYNQFLDFCEPFLWLVVRTLREDGSQCESGEVGRLVAKLPLPPGFASTLWQSDERFKKTYFESYAVSHSLIFKVKLKKKHCFY